MAKPFEARHTGSELEELADCLKSLDSETRVVMEHTGRYYEQIALLDQTYPGINALFDSPVREDGPQKW